MAIHLNKQTILNQLSMLCIVSIVAFSLFVMSGSARAAGNDNHIQPTSPTEPGTSPLLVPTLEDLAVQIRTLSSRVRHLERENAQLKETLQNGIDAVNTRINNLNLSGNPPGYCGMVLNPSDQRPGLFERMYVPCP